MTTIQPGDWVQRKPEWRNYADWPHGDKIMQVIDVDGEWLYLGPSLKGFFIGNFDIAPAPVPDNNASAARGLTPPLTPQTWCEVWKILGSITPDELIKAGVMEDFEGQTSDDWFWWECFRQHPHATFVNSFIGRNHERQTDIWSIVLRRMKR